VKEIKRRAKMGIKIEKKMEGKKLSKKIGEK
jgi:hypothetical protein